MKIGIVWIACVLAAGCQSKGGGSGDTTAGKERGPCYGNGTCDQGLVCLSKLCVAPPAADCQAIADHLGGLLLGNYAAKEERAAFATDVVADCTARKLSKEDGDCLLRASGRQAIGQCAVALGVGDCKKITEHLKAMVPAGGTDQFLVTAADRLIARCKNEVPSRGLEKCVIAATKIEQLEQCQW